MEPGLARDALTFVAGVATGVFSGAFGVGGATISTPAVRALGLPAIMAVGTTLPSILPSAVSGSLAYSRAGLVDWRIARLAAPAGIVGAIAGSLLSRAVPGEGHLLMIATACLLGVAAFRLWRSARAGAAGDDRGAGDTTRARRDGPLPVAAVGAAAGLLSGLLGLGGGIVMVPGFSEVVRMPLKQAIATSLVCVGVFAVPGTVTHSVIGGIDWRVALLLAVGVVPGARLGAAVAIRTADARLRVVVAALLSLVAAGYFVSETWFLVT